MSRHWGTTDSRPPALLEHASGVGTFVLVLLLILLFSGLVAAL